MWYGGHFLALHFKVKRFTVQKSKNLCLGLDLSIPQSSITLFASDVSFFPILCMSLSPLGEAPVGTDLSADHGSLEKGPVIATYILAVLAVGLRFYTRLRVQGQRIAADDWMIVGALVCCRKRGKEKGTFNDDFCI